MNSTARISISLTVALATMFILIQLTGAFFSDSGQSTTNTFAAAAVFPSATPTITPTPLPTNTPTPTVQPTLTSTPTPTPSNIADHIVISEIQIQGGTANEDFVELYNPTSSVVDISGWKLRVRTSSGTEDSLAVIPASSIIPAYGFYLWGNSQSGYAASIGANTSNTSNISPNNSIALQNSSSVTIDQLGWGNGNNQFLEGSIFPISPTTSQSLERKAYSSSDATSMSSGVDADNGNGYDTNNNSSNFLLRTTSQPQNINSTLEIP